MRRAVLAFAAGWVCCWLYLVALCAWQKGRNR